MFHIPPVSWEYYDSLLSSGFETYINFNEIPLRDFLFQKLQIDPLTLGQWLPLGRKQKESKVNKGEEGFNGFFF